MTMSKTVSPTGVRRTLSEQIAIYDALLWGECLDERQTRDLHTLALVFDVDVEPGASPFNLWARLRPLVTEPPLGVWR